MPFGLRNAAQTFQRLEILFKRLQDHNISINVSKCIFGAEELPFLGYLVSGTGVIPHPDRVQVISQYKKPGTIKELQRFLGMLNYYRRCLKGAANNQAVLNSYLKNTHKGDKRAIMWTQEAEDAFESCKTALANAALLAHPAEAIPLILTADASNVAIGASLEQHVDGKIKPVSFFSKN